MLTVSIKNYSLNNDRKHINKIKSDTGQTNKLFKEFEKLFQQEFGEEPGEEIKKALKNCRKERCAE